MRILEEVKNNKKTVFEVLKEKNELNRAFKLNEKLDDIRMNIASDERFDDIQSMYELNLSKLECVLDINNKSIKTRTMLLSQIGYMESIYMSDYNFINTILTSTALLSLSNDLATKLSPDNLYLVSSSMISVPLENYAIYNQLLDDELLSNIYNKTSDEKEMRQILYHLMGSCEYNDTEENKNVLYNIVNNYEVKAIQK